MDEKMIGIVIKNSLALNTCMDAVKINQNALIKQSKINRNQRLFNFMFGMIMFETVGKIAKRLSKMSEKIIALEKKIEGFEQQKGE